MVTMIIYKLKILENFSYFIDCLILEHNISIKPSVVHLDQ